MKKSRIILIIIIILFLIAIGGYVFYQKMVEEGRKYEVAKIENPQYFLLKEKEKYGVINKQGDIIIEPNYDNVIIPNPEKAVFICYQGENTKVYLLERPNQDKMIAQKENIDEGEKQDIREFCELLKDMERHGVLGIGIDQLYKDFNIERQTIDKGDEER